MKLFSLSRRKATSADPYWDFDESDHFRPSIQKNDFFTQTGFDLGWLMLEPVFSMIKKKDYELDRVKRLSFGQKALYYWWYIDAEVTNGGFVQFYYNGFDVYVEAILKGLEYVNDLEMAALIRRADTIYQRKKRMIEKAQDNETFGNILYEQFPEFIELDNRYCELNKETMALMEQYIRKHPEQFCIITSTGTPPLSSR